MAKKVKTVVKINLKAGEATPAPPVGTALGQHGVAIMDFVKAYNDKTASQKGEVVPAVITIYEDRTFDFITKKAPVADMIKKAVNLEKGSGKTPREMVGSLNLLIDNEDKSANVLVTYRQLGDLPNWPVQIRMVNGEAKYISFQNGEERVRKVGEILEPKLYRVCRNSSLPKEITVGVYREAGTPVSMTQGERINLPDKDNIYGLPVVTVFADWMKEEDSEPPYEKNARLPVESWGNIDKFGKGYAVGELKKDDSGYSFRILGYVFDSRALEVVEK